MIMFIFACTNDISQEKKQQWVYGLCNQKEYDYEADVVNKECENNLCKITAGEFLLGSCSTTLDEYPKKVVYLKSFWIDQTEVSVRQWNQCVSSGACTPIHPDCEIMLNNYESDIPIVCVDYEQASSYCSFVGGRLPTEIEWEKSARGVDGRLFPWGDSIPNCNVSNNQNYQNNFGETTRCNPYTVSVNEYLSDESPFGVYNMAGNVMEWTSTNYDYRLYQRSSDNYDGCYFYQEDSPGRCDYKTIRGGAFNHDLKSKTILNRSFGSTELKDTNIGFRCAYDSDQRP